jgi:hypothetical protein
MTTIRRRVLWPPSENQVAVERQRLVIQRRQPKLSHERAALERWMNGSNGPFAPSIDSSDALPAWNGKSLDFSKANRSIHGRSAVMPVFTDYP